MVSGVGKPVMRISIDASDFQPLSFGLKANIFENLKSNGVKTGDRREMHKTTAKNHGFLR